MLMALLGFLDILAGISLIFPNFLAFYIGLMVLIKGVSSVIGSFAVGFFFDVMGFIDLVVGIVLLLGFSVPWLWILPMIKGIYSIIAGLSG